MMKVEMSKKATDVNIKNITKFIEGEGYTLISVISVGNRCVITTIEKVEEKDISYFEYVFPRFEGIEKFFEDKTNKNKPKKALRSPERRVAWF